MWTPNLSLEIPGTYRSYFRFERPCMDVGFMATGVFTNLKLMLKILELRCYTYEMSSKAG